MRVMQIKSIEKIIRINTLIKEDYIIIKEGDIMKEVFLTPIEMPKPPHHT